MIVVDTTILLALLDARDGLHPEAVEWYRTFDGELVTTPLVLAELDYLAGRAGRSAVRAFRRDVADEAYAVDWWPTAAQEAVDVLDHYKDLGLSLTDASLVALAGRLEQTVIATFDERHFRAVRPLTGEAAFCLLPRDAELR